MFKRCHKTDCCTYNQWSQKVWSLQAPNLTENRRNRRTRKRANSHPRFEHATNSHSQGGLLTGDDSARTLASTSIMDRSHDATTVDEAAHSTYSYDSTRDWTTFFKEIDGRRFSSQAAVYILPADEVEFLRLDKQHAGHL